MGSAALVGPAVHAAVATTAHAASFTTTATIATAATATTGGGLTWDLHRDVQQLLALHFMINAYRAGTIVAVIAGAIGWFMVLRRQSFAGHTLAVVSFPGAAAAIWLGISATAGYFAGSIVAALVIAMVPRSTSGRARSEESAVIGTVQAFALLVMPAAAAQQITARPALSLAITVVLSVAITWVSLGVAFYSVYPVGFYVSSIGFAVYVLAAGGRNMAEWFGSRPPGPVASARGPELDPSSAVAVGG